MKTESTGQKGQYFRPQAAPTGRMSTRLEFDEDTHTYKLDGKRIAGVTQCLELLYDWRNVNAATLEAARNFGIAGHRAIALMVREALDWDSLDPALVPYVKQAGKFIQHFRGTVLGSEVRVVHAGFGYAGTIDLIMEEETERMALVDFKLGDFGWVGPQTAAYDRAYRYTFPQPTTRLPMKRMGVELFENRYVVKLLKEATDWHYFVNCLNVTNIRMANGYY